MRILSIVHADSDPPGLFSEVAAELEHDEWRIDEDAEPPSPIESYDAVGVFGGYMSPSDDDHLAWLRMEKGVLRELVERKVPALGICLGAQLLAEAAGAEVYPLDPPEIGWSPIDVMPGASGDAVFGDLDGMPVVFEWHSWTFDLPSGAVPLATTSRCIQAYRLPPATWGIQFHAEVTPDKLTEWLDHAETDPVARRAGVEPGRERELSVRHLPGSMDLGRRLFVRFLEHVAGSPVSRSDRAARADRRSA